MSGHHPDWLQKDQYLMKDGKKKLVDEFYFVSSPVHNSDELVVIVGGKEAKFSSLKPIPANEATLPEHLRKNQLVEFGERTNTTFDVISNIWLKQGKDRKEIVVMVSFENYPFSIEANNVRKISEENQEKAKKFTAERQAKKDHEEQMNKVFRALSKINNRKKF